MSATFEVAVLPTPLRSVNGAVGRTIGRHGLALVAGPRTDWFIDPSGTSSVHDAPALLIPAEGDWMLRARVSATHEGTFDAAVLVIHVDERTWAKLCLELAPDGRVMVVSVVTRDRSDDCNSVVIDERAAWLRIARMGPAFAFHWSADGGSWQMVRYFSLGVHDEAEVGFLAQSPNGRGCEARFEHISFTRQRLADVRSGA